MGEHDGILLDRWETTGDNQAFMELVARYQGMVFGVCVRIVKDRAKAEDLVQDCFLKLTKSRPKASNTLGPWLHRVATHASINQLRSDSRRATREKTFMAEKASHSEAAWDDIDDILDEELNTLPDENRDVIVAHFLQGHTQVEVAERLGIPRTTVSSRIKAGLDRLERKLKTRGVVVPSAALSGMMVTEMALAAPPSLAEAMGKAVLKGVFAPQAAGNSVGVKTLVPIAMALLLLAAAYLFWPNETSQPPQSGITTTTLATVTPPAETPEAEPVILAAAENDAAPETAINEEPLVTSDTKRLQCQDVDGNPVVGVSVTVYQVSMEGPPLARGWDFDRNPYQANGPLISDSEGYIEFPIMQAAEDISLVTMVYAVLPNEFVGAWNRVTNSPRPGIKEDIIRMVKSRNIPGHVVLPADVKLTEILVDTMTVSVESPDMPYGVGAGSFMMPDDPVLNGLYVTKVDTNGRFEVANLPVDGGFNIRARGAGLAEVQVHVLDSATTKHIELNLIPEGVITGTVRFQGTGTPVANRKVIGFTSSNRGISSNQIAVTDGLGQYRMTGLKEGRYEMLIGMETFPPLHVAHAKNNVTVRSGEVMENVNFTLEEGVMIHGTMTNEDTGEPIPGVLLAAMSPSWTSGVCINTVFSDDSGRYEMRMPVGNTYMYVGQTPEGIYPLKQAGKTSVTIASVNAIMEPFDFNFKADTKSIDDIGEGIVTGRVLDPSSNPIAGVLISESRKYKYGDDNHSYGFSKIGTTDDDGRFSLKLAATGTHEIMVGGYEWSAYQSESFAVVEDETKDLGDVYLVSYTQTLSAQLIDEEGEPVAGIMYSVNADDYFLPYGTRRSNSEGMIYVENLPNTEVRLQLLSPEYELESFEGMPGQHIEMVVERK